MKQIYIIYLLHVLPFEPQGSKNVEEYPSIRVKVYISVNHFITERQIRYITLKISNLAIALFCQKSFTQKSTE